MFPWDVRIVSVTLLRGHPVARCQDPATYTTLTTFSTTRETYFQMHIFLFFIATCTSNIASLVQILASYSVCFIQGVLSLSSD